jgi:plastocyanin
MARKLLIFASLLAALAVTATAALGQGASTPTLNGTVGPGYMITLKQNGKLVKNLKAGKYTLMIADKAAIHGFSLDGPHGYAKDFTKVSFKGTKTFTVDLKAGSYKYYCPPHESIMFGHFKVS